MAKTASTHSKPSDKRNGIREHWAEGKTRSRLWRGAAACLRQWYSMLSLLSRLLGGPVLAWLRTVYTRLSGTNDRAPFRPERTGNFPVAANETAADMLCCALYPRIQTFPSTDLHLHGGKKKKKKKKKKKNQCACAHDCCSAGTEHHQAQCG